MSKTTCILVITFITLFIASAVSLQCGSNTCGGTDACCNDEVMGRTCYDPSRAKCLSTHLPSSSSSGTGSKLCGANDAACNTTCYDPSGYFCCNNRQLMQKGQTCPPASTSSPTSAATQAHTTISPTTAPTSAPKPQNNCPGAANTAGVNCSSPSLCCGAGTMTPSCLPADGSKQCCVWFLSSTQCNSNQVCGGNEGYGASSIATCGPTGTVFCNKGDGFNAFCKPTDLCCGNYGQYAFCCPGNNSTCPTDYSFSCVYSAKSTTAPTQAKATVAPTIAPTSAPKPQNNCPGAAGSAGVNCSSPSLCCGSGTMTPSCLPANGSKKCCTWYLSSTQCSPDQVCGGDLGYGASSYARCGAPGTVFCNKGDAQNTFCKPTDSCCGNYGQLAFCCPSNNSTCPTDNSFNCVYSSKSQ